MINFDFKKGIRAKAIIKVKHNRIGRVIMDKEVSKKSPVADTRIKMTAFLLACIMLPSSFMPEETVVKWLIINTLVLILVLVLLYFTWQKNKFDAVRYNSLQVYILLMSIVFYAIVPL